MCFKMRDSYAAQGTEILMEKEARAETSAPWEEKEKCPVSVDKTRDWGNDSNPAGGGLPACHVTLGPLSSCQVLTQCLLLSLPPLPGATPYQTASLDWSSSSDQKPLSVPCHRALGRGAPARPDALPRQGLQRQTGAASSRTVGAISGSLAPEWIAGLGERRKLEGLRWATSRVER